MLNYKTIRKKNYWSQLKLAAIFAFVILLVAERGSSQSNLEWANTLYEEASYSKAIKLYKKVLKYDTLNRTAILNLGNCYRFINNSLEAEKWYLKATKLEFVEPSYIYYYAQALKSNSKYDEAKVQFLKYAEIMTDDPKGVAMAKSCDIIKQWLEDEPKWKINPISSLNSVHSEYAPAYFSRGIVFTSDRKHGGIGDLINGYAGNPHSDIYYSEKKERGRWKKPKGFLEDHFNTTFNEEAASVNKKGDLVVFTRSGDKKITDNELINFNVVVNKLKIYFVKKDSSGNWSDLEAYPHNSNQHNSFHPAISSDGTMLIFASDMLGGYGGTDLYVSYLEGENWTFPENLGEKINTSENEMFPFIHNDGTLFFASEGHVGYGGLDLFYANKIDSLRWGLSINLKQPLNTNRDDFGMILDEQKVTGYFASNRDGGKGKDDIYEFVRIAEFVLSIDGIVLDKELQTPLEGVTVFLTGLEEDQVITTSGEGIFLFNFDKDGDLRLKINKEGYAPEEIEITSINETQIIELEKLVTLQGMISFKNKSGLENSEAVKMKLINKSTQEVEQEFELGDSGKYKVYLKKDEEYIVIASQKGYLTNTMEISTNSNNVKEKMLFANIELEEIIKNEAIVLKNINYDFDSFIIREDAKLGLDRVVETMKENPEFIVDISSHTDTFGTMAYNMILSQKRANSAVQYIASRGIDIRRLVAHGHGYKKLLDTLAATKEEHEINRRTEFKVIGLNNEFINSLKSDTTVLLNGIIVNQDENPVDNVTLNLVNSINKVVVDTGITDLNGKFQFELESFTQYTIEAIKDGYVSNYFNITTSGDTNKIKSIFRLTEIVVNKPVRLDNISYKSGDYELNSKAQEVLDNLAKMLIENPSIIIEISSHTDEQGNTGDNLKLSQERANRVASYLLEKGVVKERILPKGYGESMLVNENASNDAEHAVNRRTEFKVLKK